MTYFPRLQRRDDVIRRVQTTQDPAVILSDALHALYVSRLEKQKKLSRLHTKYPIVSRNTTQLGSMNVHRYMVRQRLSESDDESNIEKRSIDTANDALPALGHITANSSPSRGSSCTLDDWNPNPDIGQLHSRQSSPITEVCHEHSFIVKVCSHTRYCAGVR